LIKDQRYREELEKIAKEQASRD